MNCLTKRLNRIFKGKKVIHYQAFNIIEVYRDNETYDLYEEIQGEIKLLKTWEEYNGFN